MPARYESIVRLAAVTAATAAWVRSGCAPASSPSAARTRSCPWSSTAAPSSRARRSPEHAHRLVIAHGEEQLARWPAADRAGTRRYRGRCL